MKFPFRCDSRNLKIPADQGFPATGDGNLLDLLGECMASRKLKILADGSGEDDEGRDDADSEIIELDSVELLAEHMHFCDTFEKGFKHDINLRMHKHAHENQFNTVESLSQNWTGLMRTAEGKFGSRGPSLDATTTKPTSVSIR